eukprot:jgi/Ulvmu1/6118/UM027_0096.1
MDRVCLLIDKLEVQLNQSFPVPTSASFLRLDVPLKAVGRETQSFVTGQSHQCFIPDTLIVPFGSDKSDVEDGLCSGSIECTLVQAGPQQTVIAHAIVPLSVLLGEAWVEGSASLASVPLAAGALGPGSLATAAATTIGSLSLRLALQPTLADSQVASAPPKSAASSTLPPHRHLSDSADRAAAPPATSGPPAPSPQHAVRAAGPPGSDPPSWGAAATAQSPYPTPPGPYLVWHQPTADSKSPSPVLPASWAPAPTMPLDSSSGRLPRAEYRTHAAAAWHPAAQAQHLVSAPSPGGAPAGVMHVQHAQYAQYAAVPSPLHSGQPAVARGGGSAGISAVSQSGGGPISASGDAGASAVLGSWAVGRADSEQYGLMPGERGRGYSYSVAQVAPETAQERAAREAAQWRQEQEAAAEAELAAAGVQRRSMLETEWRGQHARRAAEHEACLTKLTESEDKMARELARLEAHEAKLAVAEAQAVKAVEGLEREAAQRRGDTEGAVRRLQAELAHALDIERSRNGDAEAARDSAATAATAARSAAAASRRALRDLHQARQQSESAQAERELAAAQMEQEEAEARLQVALEEKTGLRQAAHSLARELQAVRSDAQAVADEGVAIVCKRVEQARLQVAAAEQQQQLHSQEAALRGMLGQLQALKTAEVG